jgi:DNA-binding response OmpR family regulator
MKKILVIEDEKEIRDKILQVLEYEGFEVMSAENGRIGVQVVKTHPPDLIICDILMPELNGYGVLTELRSDPLTATIPFIFLTAKVSQHDVRQGMSLGADDYLAKPFKIPDLLDAVHARLKKHTTLTKQMEGLQGDLSYALSQELRTSLHVILSFTEFLLNIDQALLPDMKDILDMQRVIHLNALRLQRLIDSHLPHIPSQLPKNKFV